MGLNSGKSCHASWEGRYNDRMSTIRAIFENGGFKPIERVDLPEHTEVEFEPRPPSSDDDGSLDTVYAVLSERYVSGEHDVAERHNEY